MGILYLLLISDRLLSYVVYILDTILTTHSQSLPLPTESEYLFYIHYVYRYTYLTIILAYIILTIG